MILEMINKIIRKSKGFKFESSRAYKAKGESTVPYEEKIVLSSKYPDFIFLVHSNMIFLGDRQVDSSYDVFSFNKQGEFVRKEDVIELGKDFFKDMKVVQIIK
jgi:hypothetical protein